ncbi:MAG: hypothetical protein U0736_01725 [Gemmataceae bacterium]
MRLTGKREATDFTGGEDAGRVSYANLRPQDLWRLRMRIGEALSAARPEARARTGAADHAAARPDAVAVAHGGRQRTRSRQLRR